MVGLVEYQGQAIGLYCRRGNIERERQKKKEEQRKSTEQRQHSRSRATQFRWMHQDWVGFSSGQ